MYLNRTHNFCIWSYFRLLQFHNRSSKVHGWVSPKYVFMYLHLKYVSKKTCNTFLGNEESFENPLSYQWRFLKIHCELLVNKIQSFSQHFASKASCYETLNAEKDSWWNLYWKVRLQKSEVQELRSFENVLTTTTDIRKICHVTPRFQDTQWWVHFDLQIH